MMENNNVAEEVEEIEEVEALYGFPMRDIDRRRNPNGRTVDIKQFYSRQHEIINLDSLGYKGTEIASMLGISPVTVSNALNSTLGKEVKSDVRKSRDEEYDELRDEVMELTRTSLKVYEEIMNADDESRKLKKETADTIVLELSGLRAPTQIDTRNLNMNLSSDEIDDFKQRGIAAAKARGKVVKLPVKEEEKEKDN